MCAAALHWAQIGTIVYGAKDIKKGYSLFTPPLLHPKTVVRNEVLADDCASLMKAFFAARRK
jgi:tRNA(adenine34) deaminase